MINIEYKISRMPRRRKMCIAISPDNKIIVKTNSSVSEKDIAAFVKNKENWIHKILEFNCNARKTFIPKQFVSGESFLFLGREYNLFVQKGIIPAIQLNDQQLNVYVPNRFFLQLDYLQKKLICWYKCSAYEVIFQRVNIYKQVLDVKVKEIMIRDLKRAWANCSSRGIITFSWRLVMAPLEIIDYVIVHELAHLIHHNHSSLFWQTVETIKPDYKQLKKWLKVNENTFLW